MSRKGKYEVYSRPNPPWWQPTNKIIIIAKVLPKEHRVQTHIGLPSLDVLHWHDKPRTSSFEGQRALWIGKLKALGNRLHYERTLTESHKILAQRQ